jgi:hypothetical protein
MCPHCRLECMARPKAPQRSHHSLSQPVKTASRMLGQRKPAHFRAVSRSRQVRVDHSMLKRRRAITLSKKDWHSAAIGAVLSSIPGLRRLAILGTVPPWCWKCARSRPRPARKSLPQRLSSDHDPLFRFHRWLAKLRILQVEEIKSTPFVPVSHPFVERLIGTIRREFLDHVLIWDV